MAVWGIFSPLGVDISISNIRWDIAEKRMSTLCSNGDFLMFFELLTVSFIDKNGDTLSGMKANWKLSTDGQKVAVLLFINGEKAFGNENIEIARICQIEGDGFPAETGDCVCKGKSDEGLLRVKILNPEIYRAYGCYHGSDRAHGAKHKLDKFKHITGLFWKIFSRQFQPNKQQKGKPMANKKWYSKGFIGRQFAKLHVKKPQSNI